MVSKFKQLDLFYDKVPMSIQTSIKMENILINNIGKNGDYKWKCEEILEMTNFPDHVILMQVKKIRTEDEFNTWYQTYWSRKKIIEYYGLS